MDDVDLVQRFYRAVETGDAEAIKVLLSPDWEEIPAVYPGQPQGAGGYLPIMKAFNAAFPDGRFTVHDIIPAPPRYTVRTTFEGTHQGMFLGRAESGKTIRFNTIDIHEIADGKIIRSWHIEDFAAFFQQVDG